MTSARFNSKGNKDFLRKDRRTYTKNIEPIENKTITTLKTKVTPLNTVSQIVSVVKSHPKLI